MSDDQQPHDQAPSQPASSEAPANQGTGSDGGSPQGGGGRRFDRNRRGGGRNPRGRRPFRNNRQDNRGPNDQGGEHVPGPDEFAAPAAGEAPVQDGPPPEPTYAEGIVEVSGKGFGFLREAKRAYAATQNDIFITPEVIREHNLRDGVLIKGETRRGPRGIQLFRATEIEGADPAKFVNIPLFEELTTISPNKRIKLETVPERFTTRVMDLMTPVGKGQRGLIVAPPRTGKTTLLQHIADAVVKNHPEMKLIILLVDERPEEVTEIKRTVPQAELYASSNDSDLRSHTRIAQIAIDRAKRLVEQGKDVFVLMDSLTRIGRAFNMELVLDRKISDQRIYPAVDIFLSGTRREELLLTPEEMHKINIIRRGLAGHKPIEAIERLLFFIRRYPTNSELLKNIPG